MDMIVDVCVVEFLSVKAGTEITKKFGKHTYCRQVMNYYHKNKNTDKLCLIKYDVVDYEPMIHKKIKKCKYLDCNKDLMRTIT